LAAAALQEGLQSDKYDARLLSLQPTDSIREKTFFWDQMRESQETKFKNWLRNAFQPKPLAKDSSEKFSNARGVSPSKMAQFCKEYDLLHIHWVDRFLDWRIFSHPLMKHKPIIWSFHDMEPFTGGCHYSLGCHGYTSDCRDCPLLVGDKTQAGRILNFKLKHWKRHKGPRVLIANSDWLKNRMARSRLFYEEKIVKIHLGIIDREKPSPVAPRTVSSNTRLLFVSEKLGNPRKGLRPLVEAIDEIREKKGFDIELSVCGRGDLEVLGLGRPWIFHQGFISEDHQWEQIYQDADALVVAAREEAFGLVVAEAMNVGLPVLATPCGGPEEIIAHGENGYVFSGFRSDQIREGLIDFIEARLSWETMAIKAQKTAKEYFSWKRVIEGYLEVYEELFREIN